MSLINPLKNGDGFLYHYTTCNTALNFILKNQSLKLNSFLNVNDPRERKSWDIAAIVPLEPRLELEQYDQISREVSNYLKLNAKLICFSCDKPSAVGAWQPEAQLDRGFAKPSMWHHYAGKHNGVCLVFDRKKLSAAFESQLQKARLFQGKVTYSDEGILPNLSGGPFVIDLTLVIDTNGYLDAMQGHFLRWYKELFFRKLNDWAYEDEYRWVYLDEHNKPRFLNFGDALEAVVVGDEVEESMYEQFLKPCANNSADIARLGWRNGFPSFEGWGQPHITHKHLLAE